ncbi:MAG: class I SAM-dependent methyltransferase, partial [Deltaproteobacteria bacterium]|nr:class I SAM-dependent methyltransferase [Deltaproteobacteria bacterium]
MKVKLPYHRYELYEASVQDPENEMEFFERVYQEVFGRKPHLLREDFCATFRNSCSWVKRNKNNNAFAVDLCKETLEYGKAHLDHLSKDEKKRISVIHDNVLNVKSPLVDVVSVSNFSIG